MSPLDRKLLRDLWRMWGQVLTIALVVACGVASYVGMISAYDSLEASQRLYYGRSRFADVFAPVRRAPRAVVEGLAEIDGVAEVEARIVQDVLLDIEGSAEPATGHVVSIPPGDASYLNRLHVRRGRVLDADHPEEALISEAFARANRLGPGSELHAVMNGRRARLRVVGVALSPEHVMAMKPGELMPDDRRFGVLWMSHDALAAAYQMRGAFNDVVLGLRRGASEARVIDAVDRLLEPYGAPGAYGRDRQYSHRTISGELKQLSTYAATMPVMFLIVAAFLVNVVLSRTLSAQREQLAALKALGYTDAEVGAHYGKFAAVVVVLGAALGVLFGAWVGQAMTDLYTQYFRFPALDFRLAPRTVLVAVGVSLGASLLGAASVLRRAVSLPPAEAMRPEAPPGFAPTWLERLGLYGLLSQAARMVARDLERRPWRTLFAVAGVSFSTAIMVVGRFTFDAIDHVMAVQFNQAQREDITVSLARSAAEDARREVAALPGVLHAEGHRALPVRLRAGHHAREAALLGLPAGGVLRRVVDQRGRDVPLPPDGLLLSRPLAERLGVAAGDAVRVEALDGPRRASDEQVAGVVDDFIGLSAYATAATLRRISRDEGALTEVVARVDPAALDGVLARLKRLPGVVGVARRDRLIRYFHEETARSTLATTFLLGLFSAIIAVGVVYNSARVALALRSRELATLRVLGFTRGEVGAILVGEQLAQVLLGIPPGLLLGKGLSALVTYTVDPELFRIPLIISPRTYATAALVVLGAAAASALLVRRKVDQLDLIGTLKARD